MRNNKLRPLVLYATLAALCFAGIARADLSLIQKHCSSCHAGEEPKGEFDLRQLRARPDNDNADYWINSLEYVRAEEMPPAEHNRLTSEERKRLVRFLQRNVNRYEDQLKRPTRVPPRRLNNREFANSLRDVLLLEDLGTHQPAAMLIGDTLKDGFDTHGETLGMSEYHLDQYITAIRKVLDATILTGDRPPTQSYQMPSSMLRVTDISNRKRAEQTKRTADSIEMLSLRLRAYFASFETVPHTGRYRIKLRAKTKDRHIYDQRATGIWDNDPIVLRAHMGDRVRDFQLRDDRATELELDEWLAVGTRLQYSFLTDGLRLQGNGNFKFQYRIAHDYIKQNNPELYQHVVTEEVPRAKRRNTSPAHWVHWVDYWQGPRPILFDATVEGPIYASWPPKRQIALLGENPNAKNAANILRPIATRAWRREISNEELQPIVNLVQSHADSLGDIEALREGIVAILSSPSFLLVNSGEPSNAERFSTKLAYFLEGTSPTDALRKQVLARKLDSLTAIRDEIDRRITTGKADEFLNEFPFGWLQLDRINFMAPDPERFPLYEKKRIHEDMTKEVLAFFEHVVRENRPVTELLTANYSFVNADLAGVYGIDGVEPDSKLRKHTFHDGKRGGFLGMAAFLTLTSDSLGTSPIHRAIYVMENFMGIHPSPPPADVDITEPDIRSATTIREVLEAHRADASCASCHQSIDPYGYAFENFDPIGAWRDRYDPPQSTGKRRNRKANPGPPVDASATFMTGSSYRDIREFRELMKTEANHRRFVRCFVTKLLTYANGIEPESYSEVDAIVERAAEHGFRIVDTIAAVIDSPLFREQ